MIKLFTYFIFLLFIFLFSGSKSVIYALPDITLAQFYGCVEPDGSFQNLRVVEINASSTTTAGPHKSALVETEYWSVCSPEERASGEHCPGYYFSSVYTEKDMGSLNPGQRKALLDNESRPAPYPSPPQKYYYLGSSFRAFFDTGGIFCTGGIYGECYISSPRGDVRGDVHESNENNNVAWGPPLCEIYWSFPVQVLDGGTKNAVVGATLNLYGYNNEILASCQSQEQGGGFNEKGFCLLRTPYYRSSYKIKLVSTPYGYIPGEAKLTCEYTTRCSSPPPPAGRIPPPPDNKDTIIKEIYDHAGTWGYYSGNVFLLARGTPTPNPTPTPIPTPTPTPTPTPIPSFPWFQTQGGDVHVKREIYSPIPAGNYFSLDGLGGFPGLVSYGESANFGRGGVSSRNWLANTQSRGSFYDFFVSLFKPMFVNPPPLGEIGNNDLGDLIDGGVKAYNGDIQTKEGLNIGIKKIVLFGSGRFLIKNRISVDQGGSLVVITRGDIGVSKDFGGANMLDGFFVTDGTFYSSVDSAFNSSNSNKQLIINGGVAAKSFNLGRDLNSENRNSPAEKFIYRPDFFFNFYSGLWIPHHLWEELAP